MSRQRTIRHPLISLDALEPRRFLSGVIPSADQGIINLTTADALPDLAIGGLVASPNADVEPGGYVWAPLHTLTPSSVPSGTKLKVFLSADTTLSSDDYLAVTLESGMGPHVFAPLISINIPSNFTPGQYHIIAVIDADNAVAESDETNNTFLANTLTVHAPASAAGYLPQYHSAYVSGDDTVAAGSRVNFHAFLEGFDQFYNVPVSFYLSADDIAGNEDDILVASGVAQRAFGTTGIGTAAAVLPASITPGSYRLVLVANDAAPFLASSLTVAPVTTDIAITSLSAPAAATPGSNVYVDVAYSVHSPAPSDYNGRFLISYVLSADDILGNEDDILLPGPVFGRNEHMTLYPFNLDHASFDRPDSFTIPDSVPAGTYRLFAVADPDNHFAETDESNNVLDAGQITVVNPDLLYSLTLASQSGLKRPIKSVTPGTPSRAALKLTNPGKSTLSRNYAVRFFLSDDATLSPDDRLFSRQSIRATLPTGHSATLPLTYTLPRTARVGTRYLIVVADPKPNKPSALRPLSATAAAAARIQAVTRINVTAPKLTATILRTKTTGDSIRLTLRITNTGNARYHSTATLQILSESSSDPLRTLNKHLSLKPGQHRNITLRLPSNQDPVKVTIS
jgi:hypothetical protein